MRPRAQLRPTFACRRKTNTEEPNSVERGAHRRKAPVPVRVCFAGADARWGYVPPASLRSSEDSVRPRAQLRLGSSNRKKTNTEEPNSVEKGAHRRKAPAPVRVVFAGAGASVKRSPPASSCSSDERMRICAQLLRARPSPELVRGRCPYLLLGGVRRRTACESAPSSG